MRKIFLFMKISTDGYFEGPAHDLNWHNVDKEFADFAIEQLDTADTLVFGRRTYELMVGFWSSDQAKKADPGTAQRMNSMSKVVFSKSMRSADWGNTTLISRDVAGTLNTFKTKPGKNIAVLGSSNLCLTLLKDNLIDEIRLMVNPVVLGKGTTLFAGLKKPINLKLKDSRVFKSGNVLLTYGVLK